MNTKSHYWLHFLKKIRSQVSFYWNMQIQLNIYNTYSTHEFLNWFIYIKRFNGRSFTYISHYGSKLLWNSTSYFLPNQHHSRKSEGIMRIVIFSRNKWNNWCKVKIIQNLLIQIVWAFCVMQGVNLFKLLQLQATDFTVCIILQRIEIW